MGDQSDVYILVSSRSKKPAQHLRRSSYSMINILLVQSAGFSNISNWSLDSQDFDPFKGDDDDVEEVTMPRAVVTAVTESEVSSPERTESRESRQKNWPNWQPTLGWKEGAGWAKTWCCSEQKT